MCLHYSFLNNYLNCSTNIGQCGSLPPLLFVIQIRNRQLCQTVHPVNVLIWNSAAPSGHFLECYKVASHRERYCILWASRTWLCFIQNTTPLSSWLNKPFVQDLIPINILIPHYIKNGTWHFITTVRHESFLHIPYYVLHLKDALFNHTITAVTVQSLLFMRTSWCLSASCSKEITQRWPWNENEWGLCVL